MVEKVRNRNNELLKSFNQITNRDLQGHSAVPLDVNKEIVPTVVLNPFSKFCDIARSQSCSNATSATIYTTPTDRDFYLTSASLSVIKDVTSTSTFSSVFITLADGVTSDIIVLSEITLTAQTGEQSMNFSFPIKLARGINITIKNSTNVANIISRASITGFTYQGDIFGGIADPQ